MPLIAPLISHRPNATQLYASAGSGGGSGVSSLNALSGSLSLTSTDNSVTIVPSGSSIDLSAVGGGGGVASVTGSTNISITGTATDPIVNALNLQVSQTAFSVSLSSPTQNGTPENGITNIPMGGSFTVPKTGLYLFSAQTISDVGEVAGEDIVVGVSDYCAVYINTVPPLPGLVTSTFTMVTPISMTYTTNSPAGVDTVVTATNIVPLTAGITYAMTAQVYRGIAGALRFPASAPGGVIFNGRLVPLC